MKKYVFIIVLLIGSLTVCLGQGMSRFEIWGWNGSKQEFAHVYLEQTGKDLNKTYACAAWLNRMGYKHADSVIFIDNMEDFKAGRLSWDSIERVVNVRQIMDNEFTTKAADSLVQIGMY